jgi:L-fuculose-phosphate aldolase
MFDAAAVDQEIADSICLYAHRLSARGWVHNTLGNVAVRRPHVHDPVHGVVYTKHLGVSLEEMTTGNVVVTDVRDGLLLHGETPPSIGNSMNRAIFRSRPDVHAVVHLHPNETIAYFRATGAREFRFVSIDTPLVLAADVHVLEPNINVEKDAHLVREFIRSTNSFIMPNHGATTVGRTLSEAYHRMTSLVAETTRVIEAIRLSAITGEPVAYVPDAEKRQLFRDAEAVLYEWPRSRQDDAAPPLAPSQASGSGP